MQKPCNCDFLFGVMTSQVSKNQISQALAGTEETQVIILLYKNDGNWTFSHLNLIKRKGIKIYLILSGTNFLCKVLIAPVKNENSEVILFILNFDELNETPDNKFSPGLEQFLKLG